MKVDKEYYIMLTHSEQPPAAGELKISHTLIDQDGNSAHTFKWAKDASQLTIKSKKAFCLITKNDEWCPMSTRGGTPLVIGGNELWTLYPAGQLGSDHSLAMGKPKQTTEYYFTIPSGRVRATTFDYSCLVQATINFTSLDQRLDAIESKLDELLNRPKPSGARD